MGWAGAPFVEFCDMQINLLATAVGICRSSS
jgi:hypothetical protein